MKKVLKILLVFILIFSIILICSCTQSRILKNQEINMVELPSNTDIKDLSTESSKYNDLYKNIDKKDDLFFIIDGECVIYTNGNEIRIPINELSKLPIRRTQIFLSENHDKIYFNTNFSSYDGEIFEYDIKKNLSINIIQKYNIKTDGYISCFDYKKDKIVAIIGKSERDSDNNVINKRETNKMLIIDLKESTYKILSLSFTPHGISDYSGLKFFGDNILLCHSGYLTNKNTRRSIDIVDNEGKVIRNLNIKEATETIEAMEVVEFTDIYNISVSNDNKYITYQLGQTPTSLYLFDIDNNRVSIIHDSDKVFGEKNEYSYCIYSTWSIQNNIIYFLLLNSTFKGKDIIEEYKFLRYDITTKMILS